MTKRIQRACAATACVLLAASGCRPTRPAPGQPTPEGHRAIFLSIDSFNEQRVLTTLDSATTPAIRALFADGACADGVRPAFPSLTAPGHASLWTGVYGDVSGISANSQPQLPRDQHALTDLGSGFSPTALRAEPLWITAAAQGLRVVAHHVTQAPQAPGYPAVSGARDSALEARRARAERVLAMPSLDVLNGYNHTVAPDLAIDEKAAPPHDPRGWAGLDALHSAVPPREIAWKAGPDSVFALLYGPRFYTNVLVAPVRDAARGVVASLAPVERAPVRGRPLARHFSEPLVLPAGDGAHAWLRVRLFELDTLNATRFLIVEPAMVEVEANRPGLGDDYQRAIGGWVPNGAERLLESGRLGRTLIDGGDGTAELRYLETAELVTRQFMRGAEWAWNTKPSLMLDYFPLGDEADHTWYGYVVPGTPPYDAALATRLQEMRNRAWTMVDLRVAQLQGFVRGTPGAALFVGGDHGMRPTWREFRPNAALAAAGLLAVDSAGHPDLARTTALSPNGAWVTLNRTAWKGGIVPPAAEGAVLDSAEHVLERVRGPDGQPVVTRVWRAADTDSLGIGGPVGGDLYYALAPGYRFSPRPQVPAAADARPLGQHGFPSVDADMHTVFCALGTAFPAHRTPPARTIDEAPTLAAWLGIQPPPQAKGRSQLEALTERAGAARR